MDNNRKWIEKIFKKTKWSEEISVLDLSLPWMAYLWRDRDPDKKATKYADFGGNKAR